MNTLTINHSNGNSTTYQLIQDGQNLPIAYREKTPINVINALEYCRKNRIRIKINLGNLETGKSWNEEHDICGYVGLSKGNNARYPILVCNASSYGGCSIMDDSILQIKASKGKRVIYQANNFSPSTFEITTSDLPEYTHNVNINGELYSRHKSERAAKMLISKLS